MLGDAAHQRLGQYEWWHTAVGLFESDLSPREGLWSGWAIQ